MNWLQSPVNNMINARCETGCPTLRPCSGHAQAPCNSKINCGVYGCTSRACNLLVCWVYNGN